MFTWKHVGTEHPVFSGTEVGLSRDAVQRRFQFCHQLLTLMEHSNNMKELKVSHIKAYVIPHLYVFSNLIIEYLPLCFTKIFNVVPIVFKCSMSLCIFIPSSNLVSEFNYMREHVDLSYYPHAFSAKKKMQLNSRGFETILSFFFFSIKNKRKIF